MISIVIPCFNAEKFLAETLDSVFSQTFRDYEVIVIDDGSSDGSADIIRSYGSKIRSHFGPNCGVSAARNKGTALATGEFIQYLDADDLLLPDALEKRLMILREKNADVAYSSWQKIGPDGRGGFKPEKIYSNKIEDVDPDPEIAIFTGFWSPPAALLYRSAIVKKIGGWKQWLPIIQDARFMLDAALSGAIFAHVESVGALYRVHSVESLSNRDPHAAIRDRFENAADIEKYWRTHGGINKQRKKALLSVYGGVARASFENMKPLFEKSFAALTHLDPEYAPQHPVSLGLLSRFTGYRNAEQVALMYRRTKKFFMVKL